MTRRQWVVISLSEWPAVGSPETAHAEDPAGACSRAKTAQSPVTALDELT